MDKKKYETDTTATEVGIALGTCASSLNYNINLIISPVRNREGENSEG